MRLLVHHKRNNRSRKGRRSPELRLFLFLACCVVPLSLPVKETRSFYHRSAVSVSEFRGLFERVPAFLARERTVRVFFPTFRAIPDQVKSAHALFRLMVKCMSRTLRGR